jgi:hypothetical protein
VNFISYGRMSTVLFRYMLVTEFFFIKAPSDVERAASFSDKDALLVGTGRRVPTGAERAALGELAAKIPFVLG